MPNCMEVDFTLSIFQDEQDPARDGWIVEIKTPQGPVYLNGDPDTDVGFPTADDAITGVRKWCTDRGFTPPSARFRLRATR